MAQVSKDSKPSSQINDNKTEITPANSVQKKKVAFKDAKILGFFQSQASSTESLKTKAQNSESKLVMLDEATRAFFKKKLDYYKNLFEIVIERGLPAYPVSKLSEEKIEKHLQTQKGTSSQKEIAHEIKLTLIHSIDNSKETLPALARLCKEQLVFAKHGAFAEFKYENILELIMSEANLMNYLPEEEFASKERIKHKFRVWEWKDELSLGLVANLSEVDRIRKLRLAIKKLLGRLLKLITELQEIKYEEDSIIFLKEKQKFEKIEIIYEDLRNRNRPQISGENSLKVPSKGLPSSTTKRTKLSDKRPKASKQKETYNSTHDESGSFENSLSRNSYSDADENRVSKNSVLTKFFNTKQKDTPQVDIGSKNTKELFKFLGNSHRISEWDSTRKENFDSALQTSGRLEVSIDSLIGPMALKKRSVNKRRPKSRKVYIRIHDSFRKITGVFSHEPKVVNGRRPFAREPEIEYDVDSEEEYEDRNAENLEEEKEDKEEDSDGEGTDEENGGFIVSDGHLSEDEGGDKTDTLGDSRKENTVQISIAKPIYFNLNQYQAGTDQELDALISAHTMINLSQEAFPLQIKNYHKERSSPQQNFFENPDNLIDFVRAFHGSYQAKEEIINAFKTRYPRCKKIDIEKKLQEISVKEKLENDKKGIESEYDKILRDKKTEFLSKKEEKKKQREADKLRSGQSRKVSKSRLESVTQTKIEDFKLQAKPRGSPAASCVKLFQEDVVTPSSKSLPSSASRKLYFYNPFARFDPFHAAPNQSLNSLIAKADNASSKRWNSPSILLPSVLNFPQIPTENLVLIAPSERLSERKQTQSQGLNLPSVETELFKGSRLTFSPAHSE